MAFNMARFDSNDSTIRESTRIQSATDWSRSG
jgi:hypothetical protein